MTTTENYNGWQKQPFWHGNRELNYDSWMKEFSSPAGRKIPVYVFGDTKHGYSFMVSAGASSEFSYGGSFYPEKIISPNEAMDRVDQKDKDRKLIY